MVISVGFLGTSRLLWQCSWKSARLMVIHILSHQWHSLLLLNFGGSFCSYAHSVSDELHVQPSTTLNSLPWSPNLIIGCDFGPLLLTYHCKYYSPEKETHVNLINSYEMIWYLLLSSKSVHK
jgi:hypothetical protein